MKAGVCVSSPSISLTTDLAAFCCHIDIVLNFCYALLGCETFSPAPLEMVLSYKVFLSSITAVMDEFFCLKTRIAEPLWVGVVV